MNELKTHHAITPALGVGCRPVIISGEKEQFLDWLSWGVESGAIHLPVESRPIHWPALSLEEIFSRKLEVDYCGVSRSAQVE